MKECFAQPSRDAMYKRAMQVELWRKGGGFRSSIVVRSTLLENLSLSALKGKPEVLTPDGGAGVHGAKHSSWEFEYWCPKGKAGGADTRRLHGYTFRCF